MTKKELVSAMAEKAGISKQNAEEALNAFVNTVTEELKKGGKVQLVGFGTFEVAEKAARDGVNPHTKEVVQIAAHNAPRFKPGKPLKEAVKN